MQSNGNNIVGHGSTTDLNNEPDSLTLTDYFELKTGPM